MQINLDPSPRNELGKGILDPAEEQKLLADGYTYARRVFAPDGQFHLRVAKSDIATIATNLFASIPFQINSTVK